MYGKTRLLFLCGQFAAECCNTREMSLLQIPGTSVKKTALVRAKKPNGRFNGHPTLLKRGCLYASQENISHYFFFYNTI
jgi:hypothetical protein